MEKLGSLAAILATAAMVCCNELNEGIRTAVLTESARSLAPYRACQRSETQPASGVLAAAVPP